MKISQLPLFSALVAGMALASTAQAQTKPGTTKPNMAAPIGLTGIVAGSFTGREFVLRANGTAYRVRPLAKVDLKSVRGGDQVRVWGRPSGLRINFANVRVVQRGASSDPTDFNPPPNQTIEKQATN